MCPVVPWMVRSWYCGWYSVMQSVTASCSPCGLWYSGRYAVVTLAGTQLCSQLLQPVLRVSCGTVDGTQLLLWPVLSCAVSYCSLFSMCPVAPWLVHSWYCGWYSVMQSVTAACSPCVLWYCGWYIAGTVDGTQLCSKLLQPVLHVSCCTVDGT